MSRQLPGTMGLTIGPVSCIGLRTAVTLGKAVLKIFWVMFSLCIMNMVMTIGEIYQKGIEEKEARMLFAKRLEIIKQGAARE